jgi:hypothetical protein
MGALQSVEPLIVSVFFFKEMGNFPPLTSPSPTTDRCGRCGPASWASGPAVLPSASARRSLGRSNSPSQIPDPLGEQPSRQGLPPTLTARAATRAPYVCAGRPGPSAGA